MKILLCGACGRMGRMVSELAPTYGHEIACGVDLSPAPTAFPLYTDFSDIRETADVMIDFSSVQNLEERLQFCDTNCLPAVLAATGYSDEDLRLIDAFAKKLPLFKTGNLSLGINVLQLLAERAAKILDGFDVEIIERHHNKKKDAPSGTALMLAESIDRAGGKEYVYGRHGMVGERNKREIGIHAVRGGNIVGEHEVMFAGEDEILTVSHSARSRKVFAVGAVKAAKWICGKPAGLYSMADMLE